MAEEMKKLSLCCGEPIEELKTTPSLTEGQVSVIYRCEKCDERMSAYQYYDHLYWEEKRKALSVGEGVKVKDWETGKDISEDFIISKEGIAQYTGESPHQLTKDEFEILRNGGEVNRG